MQRSDALWSTAPRADIEPEEVRQVKPQKGGVGGAAVHRQYLMDLVLCIRTLQLEKHQRPVSIQTVMAALNVQHSTMQLMLKDAQSKGLIVIRDREALVANDRIGSIFHTHDRPRECVLYFPSDEAFCRELQRDNEGGESEIYADVSPPISSRRVHGAASQGAVASAPEATTVSSDDELTSAMERLEAKTSRRTTPPSTARSAAATTSLAQPVAVREGFATLDDVAVVSSSSGTDTPTPSMASTRKSAEPVHATGKHNHHTKQRRVQRSDEDSSGDAVVIKQSARQASAYKLHTDLKKSTSMRSVGSSGNAAVESSRSGSRMHAPSVLSSAREEARQLFPNADDEHVDVTPSRSFRGSTGGYLHRKRGATVVVSAEGRSSSRTVGDSGREPSSIAGGSGVALESRSPSMLMGTRLSSSAALERRSSSMTIPTIPDVFHTVEELVASEAQRRDETIRRYDGVMGVLSAQARVELTMVLNDLEGATLRREAVQRQLLTEAEANDRMAVGQERWFDARAHIAAKEASHRMMLCLRCLMPAQEAVFTAIRRQQIQARCMLLLEEMQTRENTLRCAAEHNAAVGALHLLQIERFDAVSLRGLERTVLQAERHHFCALVAEALYAQKCIDATALWAMETTGPVLEDEKGGDHLSCSRDVPDASARLLLVRNMFLEDERMQREHIVERSESECWSTIVAMRRCSLEEIHERSYRMEDEERARHGLSRVHLMRSEEGQRDGLQSTAVDVRRRILRLELCAREPFSRHSVVKALLTASHRERIALKQRMFEDVESMDRQGIVDAYYAEVVRMVVSFTDDVGAPHSRGADAQERLMLRVYYWQRKSLVRIEGAQREWLVGVEALQGDITRANSVRAWEGSARAAIETQASSARCDIQLVFAVADEALRRWAMAEQCLVDLALMRLECCEGERRSHLLAHTIVPQQWALRIPTVLFFEVVARYFRVQEEQRRRRHRCIAPFIEGGEAISRRRIAQLEHDAYRQNLAPRMEDHAEQMSVATHALRQLYRIVIADEHLHRRLLFTRFAIGLKKLLVADFYEEEAFDRWDVLVPAQFHAMENTLRRNLEATERAQRLSMCAAALVDAHHVAAVSMRQQEGKHRGAITAQQGHVYRQLFLGEVFAFTATRIAMSEGQEYLRNVLMPATSHLECIHRRQVALAYRRGWLDTIAAPLLIGLEPLVRVRNVEHWEQTFRLRNIAEPEQRGQLAAAYAATHRRLLHDVRLGAVVLAEARDRGHICTERTRTLFHGSLPRMALQSHALATKRAESRAGVLEALAIREDQLLTEEACLRRCLVAHQDRSMWLQRDRLDEKTQGELTRRGSRTKVASNPFCDVVYDDTVQRGAGDEDYLDVSDGHRPPTGLLAMVAHMLRLEHEATNPQLRMADIAAVEREERTRTIDIPFGIARESTERCRIRKLEVVAREVIERRVRAHQAYTVTLALALQRLSHHESLARMPILQRQASTAEALHWSGPCEATARHRIASQEGAVFLAACTAELTRLEMGQRKQRKALEAATRDLIAVTFDEVGYRHRCMTAEHERFFTEALRIVDALATAQHRATVHGERDHWHTLALQDNEGATRDALQARALHPFRSWKSTETVELEAVVRHAICRRAYGVLDVVLLLASEGQRRILVSEQEAAVTASDRCTFHSTNVSLLCQQEARRRHGTMRDEHASFAVVPIVLEELNARHALHEKQLSKLSHAQCQHHCALEELARKALQQREDASFRFRSMFWAEARDRLLCKQEEDHWFVRFAFKASFVLETAALEESATRTITEFAHSSPKHLREDVLIPICMEEESASRAEMECDGIVAVLHLQLQILMAMESVHRRQCVERPYDVGRRTAWFNERAVHDRVEIASDARQGYERVERAWKRGWDALQANELAAQMALSYTRMHRQQLLLHIRRLQIFASATEQAVRMQLETTRSDELRRLRHDDDVATARIAERNQRNVLAASAWRTLIRCALDAMAARERLQRWQAVYEEEHATVLADVLTPFVLTAEGTRRMEINADCTVSFSVHWTQFCAVRALQETTEAESAQRQHLMALQWTTLIQSQRAMVVELEQVHRQQWHLLPLRQHVCTTIVRAHMLHTEAREATARAAIRNDHGDALWQRRLACKVAREEVHRHGLLRHEAAIVASAVQRFTHSHERLALCEEEASGREDCCGEEWRALYGAPDPNDPALEAGVVHVSELVTGGEAIERRGIRRAERAAWIDTVLSITARMREPAHRASLSTQLDAEHGRLLRYVGCSIDLCILSCTKEPKGRGPIAHDAFASLLDLHSGAISGHQAIERRALMQAHSTWHRNLQRLVVASEAHCYRSVTEQVADEAFEALRQQQAAAHAQAFREQTLREELEAAQEALASLDANNALLFDDLKGRMVAFQHLEQTRREARSMARAHRRAVKELARVQTVLAGFGDADHNAHFVAFAEQDADSTNVVQQLWIACESPDPRRQSSAFENPDLGSGGDDDADTQARPQPPEVISVSADAPSPIPSKPHHVQHHAQQPEPHVAYPLFPNSPRIGSAAVMSLSPIVTGRETSSAPPATLDPASFVVPPLDLLPRHCFEVGNIAERARRISSRLQTVDTLVERCQRCKQETVVEQMSANDALRMDMRNAFQREIALIEAKTLVVERYETEVVHHIHRGTGTSSEPRPRAAVDEYHAALATEARSLLRSVTRGGASEIAALRQQVACAKRDANAAKAELEEQEREHKQSTLRLKRDLHTNQHELAQLDHEVADWREQNAQLRERHLIALAARNHQRLETAKQRRQQTPRRVPTPRSARGHGATTPPSSARVAANQTPRNGTTPRHTTPRTGTPSKAWK